MKYFMAFILLSYLGGMLFWKFNPRVRKVMLLGLCLLLTFAFFMKKL